MYCTDDFEDDLDDEDDPACDHDEPDENDRAEWFNQCKQDDRLTGDL